MQNSTKQLRNLRTTIGNNIHNIRKSRKLTLKKLSRLTNINIELLDQYELGKNEITLQILCNISDTLGVSVESLFINSS